MWFRFCFLTECEGLAKVGESHKVFGLSQPGQQSRGEERKYTSVPVV